MDEKIKKKVLGILLENLIILSLEKFLKNLSVVSYDINRGRCVNIWQIE